MTLKNVKIKINEIPAEWTKRLRSGHTNVWNENSEDLNKPEVKLLPPLEGLYAERFDDGWYWVCGCDKCLEIKGRYSYIVCDNHNICVACGTHRKDLTEVPWGHPDGFECKPCQSQRKKEAKSAALKKAKERGLDESDCYRESTIKCPVCFTDNDCEEVKDGDDITCYICDSEFSVEVEFEPLYTTRIKE